MKVKYEYMLDDIRQRYNLDSKVIADSNIYIKMQKNTRFKASSLPFLQLSKNYLELYRYKIIEDTIGL